jgi:hypothetical protein
MNTVFCIYGHKARPTQVGYMCPICQQWGNMPQTSNKGITDEEPERTTLFQRFKKALGLLSLFNRKSSSNGW